jgi:hypothetical protein
MLPYRLGKYHPLRMHDVFTTDSEMNVFIESELYDMQLYEYASGNFMRNFELTQCSRRSAAPNDNEKGK